MTIKIDKNCGFSIVDEDWDTDYLYVYIILLNLIDLIQTTCIIREDEDTDLTSPYDDDGYYTIYKLKLPKAEGYYINHDSIYKNGQEVDLSSLINKDTITLGMFSTCHLRKCYIKLCKEIFDNTSFSKCKRDDISDKIYLRDLILSIYNSILYMIDLQQYWEAERLLERVLGCGELCPKCNCGCS